VSGEREEGKKREEGTGEDGDEGTKGGVTGLAGNRRNE
jgi:hypothetical protein